MKKFLIDEKYLAVLVLDKPYSASALKKSVKWLNETSERSSIFFSSRKWSKDTKSFLYEATVFSERLRSSFRIERYSFRNVSIIFLLLYSPLFLFPPA